MQSLDSMISSFIVDSELAVCDILFFRMKSDLMASLTETYKKLIEKYIMEKVDYLLPLRIAGCSWKEMKMNWMIKVNPADDSIIDIISESYTFMPKILESDKKGISQAAKKVPNQDLYTIVVQMLSLDYDQDFIDKIKARYTSQLMFQKLFKGELSNLLISEKDYCRNSDLFREAVFSIFMPPPFEIYKDQISKHIASYSDKCLDDFSKSNSPKNK